jgi:hypothetical protein
MTITTDATTDSITFNASGGGGGFDGTATNTVSSGSIVFQDNAVLYFGTGSDFEIFSNGSGLYIDTIDDTQDITIRNTANQIVAGFDMGTKAFVGGGDGNFTGDVSAVNFNSTSDESLKENVETIDSALAKVINLRGVNFNWKENAQPGTGLIAQEVEEIIPQVITENDDGIKHVQYGNLVGLLIEAIKEQQNQIEELKGWAHPPRGLHELEGGQELLELLKDVESRLDKLES